MKNYRIDRSRTVEINISDVADSVYSCNYAECVRCFSLFLQVYDSNILWDSFMGRAVIQIDVNDSVKQLSVPLKGKGRKSGEEMPGTLTVKVACYADLKSL